MNRKSCLSPFAAIERSVTLNIARAFAVMLLGIICALPASAQLFVHSLGNREFGVVDLDALTYNRIGFTDVELFDIAFNPAGDLFGITGDTNNRGLYSINPETAATSLVGIHNVLGLNALAFRTDGILFAAGPDTLYTMNPTTGDVTVLGNMSGFRSAGDVAFDRDGNLYMTTTTNQLVLLNQLTGAATLIGDLGFSGVFGMAYDPDRNIMYGITDASGGRRIFQINLTTGTGFAPSTYPSGINIGGGSFRREAVVVTAPEPGAVALLLPVIVVFVASRRRRVRR